LCGIEVPDGIDGVSLSPLLTTGRVTNLPRDHIISESYGMAMLTQPYRNGSRGDSMRLYRTERYKYVNVHGFKDLLFDLENDPREFRNAIDDPELVMIVEEMASNLNTGFSWEETLERINRDRERAKAFLSGVKPTTPNQYRLPDGRIFDAEGDLYGARWLQTEIHGMSGIIPQRYG